MSEPVGFDEWYRKQHPKMASALLLLCREPALAAEVADEALARALERWDRVSAMDSPTGWTYRTAVNLLRRTQRRRSIEARLLRHRLPESPVEPSAGWDPHLVAAVRALPERQRAALVLRYVADLSVEDTARALGVAPGTIRASTHAARAALATALGTGNEPDDDPSDTLEAST